MLLALSTWPEIEARLKASKTVVVPIGSNEQHGPTGLLGTDWLCPVFFGVSLSRYSTIFYLATNQTNACLYSTGTNR